MKTYALGFLFDNETGKVLLIRKTKPEWAVNKLNGVGGKIERGEKPLDAMIREFEEEAGATMERWRHFATMISDNHVIWCYYDWFFKEHEIGNEPRTMTEEVLEWHDINNLPDDVIENVKFLVPLALSFDNPNYITNPVIINRTGIL